MSVRRFAPSRLYDGGVSANTTTRHLTLAELEAGLDAVRLAPRDQGSIALIVRRPRVGERELLDVAQFDVVEGLVGDSWKLRPSSRTPDRTPHPDMQVNIIGVRAIALMSPDRSRWQLAGDQLFVDMDLSAENLPPGTRLEIGTAVLEVTDQPHTGCGKFADRFGVDAMKFVNSTVGHALNLRGINARVVRNGVVRVGERVCRS
jgi:MOSC domain